jgi:cytoskeletal protein CcmA (bactofilin family)
MSKSAAFVLPAGLEIDVSGGVFSLTHGGDVVLEQTLGLPIGTIKTTGSLSLSVDDLTGVVEAGGDATITGNVSGSLTSGAGATISGDVSGSITSQGDTKIGGTVSGTVQATGSVIVSGKAEKAAITADGAIHIEGAATGGDLQSKGKITVDGDVDGASLRAADIAINGGKVSARSLYCDGSIELAGDLSGDLIHGEVVTLSGANIQVKAISATKKIVITGSSLTVDVLIAPLVEISDAASGRVTVIESSNEVNSGKIKGGFSLAEYGDLFGDSAKFLTDRGLVPLGETVTPPAAVTPTSDEPDSATEEPEVETSADAEKKVESAEAGSEAVDDEEEIEIVAASVDPPKNKSTAKESVDLGNSDEFYTGLTDAIDRITACYEGGELPSAISDLQTLVVEKDYDGLKSNITDVWNGLLGYHQAKGIRPHHQVTHAFNVIHGLIQKSV